jgi:hypothetical protein
LSADARGQKPDVKGRRADDLGKRKLNCLVLGWNRGDPAAGVIGSDVSGRKAGGKAAGRVLGISQ